MTFNKTVAMAHRSGTSEGFVRTAPEEGWTTSDRFPESLPGEVWGYWCFRLLDDPTTELTGC